MPPKTILASRKSFSDNVGLITVLVAYFGIFCKASCVKGKHESYIHDLASRQNLRSREESEELYSTTGVHDIKTTAHLRWNSPTKSSDEPNFVLFTGAHPGKIFWVGFGTVKTVFCGLQEPVEKMWYSNCKEFWGRLKPYKPSPGYAPVLPMPQECKLEKRSGEAEDKAISIC